MSSRLVPKYPIYIPSKGRAETALTPAMLGDLPYHLTIEPQEVDRYAAAFGEHRLLVLPFSDLGSVVPARNWIKAHATASGAKWHWQLDDNISQINRLTKGQFTPFDPGHALSLVEAFCDRYANIAIAGLSNRAFARLQNKPFAVNKQVYCCVLVNNSIPHEWRGRYSEDTDFSLQVLTDGWCTVRFYAFTITKAQTMSMRGGNTDAIYQGDGKLRMARALQRQWPGLVKVERRFGIPRQSLTGVWRRFTTPLEPRA